jgi:molecular chaperone GrpE
MAQQPDGSVPPNTVVQVFQTGYQLLDRMLRPARVVVSKPPEGDDSGT